MDRNRAREYGIFDRAQHRNIISEKRITDLP